MKTDVYLHGDKDEMWQHGERLGLKEEALKMFRHACTEVKLTLEVDEATGAAKIVAVDDKVVGA